MTRSRTILLTALLVAIPACERAVAPAASLVDRASRLSADERARVERYLDFVKQEESIDYRVVLADPGTTASPESSAREWFEELDVGGSRDGRGLLLWIDPERSLARVEVGYALEGVIPDPAAAWIIEAYLAPRVRGAELGPAVEATAEGLIDRIRPRLEELAEAKASPGSGGAGARVDLGRPPDPPSPDPAPLALAPQPDPRAVRDLELAMMHEGHYDPRAAIYDEAWRHTRTRGNWTPERLREIADRFDQPYEVAEEGEYAVAYALDAPEVGPTLLRRERAGWIIDATAGARLVVYDYSNELWYLIDEPSPWVDLLREALELRPVRLEGGRSAWTLAR